MKQLVGLVYDLRSDYLSQGFTEDDVAEFDSDKTIDSLEAAIVRCGYDTDRIGHGKSLASRLAEGDRWDMVFNIAEGIGGRCRESHVPALLEMYGIAYTFSDPLVCALTLDKAMTKQYVGSYGLATAAYAVVEKLEDIERIELKYPLFAKPLAEGTGKGIDQKSMIEDAKQLRLICSDLLDRYGQSVLVERYLPGREFTVGVVGTGPGACVLGTMEIEMASAGEPAIYSYLNKEECESRIIYHPLEDDISLKEKVETLALSCYRVLQCRDAGRVDIRCDDDGAPCFIEINPLAGLDPYHSDLPMIATQQGVSYDTLIGGILESAFERKRIRSL